MGSKKTTTGRPFLDVGRDMKLFRDDLSSLEDCSLSELLNPMSATLKKITPEPGFCVKGRTGDGAKIFINICHHPDVPFSPELQKATPFFGSGKLEKPLNSFPLSLGEPHTEADKSGELCQCYDVVVNTDCLKKTKDLFYQDIIMSISVAGLERKYGISIDIESCKVLNKKYHGTMSPHFIRMQAVQEIMDSSDPSETDKNNKLSLLSLTNSIRDVPQDLDMKVIRTKEIRNSPPVESTSTTYKLFQVPSSGSPSLLIFQALMPATQKSSDITVHISESNLVVKEQLCKEVIDIALPFKVDKKNSFANFFEGKFLVAMPITTPK